MQIEVMPFGQVAEITGTDKFLIDAADTDALQRALVDRFPGLKDKSYAIAVNREVINQNTPLSERAEVALLPPFSGG